MADLQIPIRELHARTGHYVRKAAAHGSILVTHRGQPMAELRPLSKDPSGATGAKWSERKLLADFAAVEHEPVGGLDSSLAVAEDRDQG